MFVYPMGATVVANLTGADLDDVIVDQKAKAEGFMFNVRLAVHLRKKVKTDKHVADCMSDKEFAKLFAAAQEG